MSAIRLWKCGKQNKHCMIKQNNTTYRDNDDNKYYGIQHGLKKVFEPRVNISAAFLWSQDDAKSTSNQNMV